jgi:hypothetical protein
MRPEEIRKLLRAKRFRPFRIYVSDGATYDVPHPEAIWLLGPILGARIRPSGFTGPPGTRVAHVSLLHITRIEVYFPGPALAP